MIAVLGLASARPEKRERFSGFSASASAGGATRARASSSAVSSDYGAPEGAFSEVAPSVVSSYDTPKDDTPPAAASGPEGRIAEEPASYNFEYAVQDEESGSDFGQQESREGDNTSGSYYVLMPDGRMQIVNYSVAADTGYVVDIQVTT